MNKTRIFVGNFAERSHIVSEGEILRYAELSGDDNPIHVSDSIAKKMSFPGMVSHGVLTMSLISRVIGTDLPGPGTLWINQSINFADSVHVGDRLCARVEILKVHEKDNLVDLQTTVTNQRGTQVLRGTGRVRVPEEELPDTQTIENKFFPVLILGASSSVGKSLTAHMLKRGHPVIATFNKNPDDLEEILGDQSFRVKGSQTVHLDLNTLETLSVKLDEIRKRGVCPLALINCLTSTPTNQSIESADPEKIIASTMNEARAILHGTRALLPEMKVQRFGRIINIGSSVTRMPPEPGWISYVASKNVALSIIRSLAVELGPTGITVNTVSPGLLGCGISSGFGNRQIQAARFQTPTRRLPSLASVAHTIDFLFEPDCVDINGQELVIDGGRS